MKILNAIIFFTLTATTIQSVIADHVVTFFMRPYPHLFTKQKKLSLEKIEHKSKKLQNPKKLAKYTLRSILETKVASGIFCTYSGQLAISDDNGQVTFARRQEDKEVKLLITEKIDPVLMGQQTIHHWEFEIGVPAKLYTVKQKNDEETGLQFWHVKENTLPVDNNISLDTIVIFARPKDIIVPEGITLVEQDAQLIIPDIYVKKNINKLNSSLYILNLKRFFAFTKKEYTVKDKQYSLKTLGS
ncbi:hypothetical protein KAH94_02455 [bacterium]|nr:hypothetical protein [bacterium]